MAIVFLPLTRPADLKDGTNGKLGPCQLAPVFFPGYGWSSLHTLAKRAYEAMLVAAQAVVPPKLKLTVTPGGAYRAWQRQYDAFMERMSPTDTGTGITRIYNGKVYWLKPGWAPVAAPEWRDNLGVWHGGSNHGWGLAIDLALWDGMRSLGITTNTKVWQWLQENAESFGFSWEGAKPGEKGWEPWHLRYVAAEKVPQRVLDIENFLKAAG